MEHWEDLREGGYRLLWDDALFPPTTDSFLLSSLPRLRPGLRVCDLGCGTGLLGLLLLQRGTDLSVTGIEIDPAAADLMDRCATANGLQDRLVCLRMDLRDVRQRLPAGGFDLVVSNPPYYEAARGGVPDTEARRTARAGCTVDDVARAAAWLLRHGGAFCLCGKPGRLADLLCVLRDAGCEAKRIRFAHERAGDAPSLVLIEGRKDGRPGLSIERPLILHQDDGSPTEELDRIYLRR